MALPKSFRRGIVLFAVAWLLLIPPGPVSACLCAGISIENAIASAHFVLLGTVIDRRAPSAEDRLHAGRDPRIWVSSDMVRYTVLPTASWKGATGDTLYLYSEQDGASCGYGFRVGEEYLVFGYIRAKELSDDVVYAGGATLPLMTVGLCSGTTPARMAAGNLAVLGAPIWKSGTNVSHAISPCPAPQMDVKTWIPVEQARFTFSMPPDFRETKVQGIDSWVRKFESVDSSAILKFDWGHYSDNLRRRRDGVLPCEEEIGGRKALVITASPGGQPDPFHGEFDYAAGATWRDIEPGVHLTIYGWARDRERLDQLLRIFRTVRFSTTSR